MVPSTRCISTVHKSAMSTTNGAPTSRRSSHYYILHRPPTAAITTCILHPLKYPVIDKKPNHSLIFLEIKNPKLVEAENKTIRAIRASPFKKKKKMPPPPEKPTNFAQTCNLLSRYVKEKGSLRDLNIEIGGKVESLETIVKPGSFLAVKGKSTPNPRQTRSDSAVVEEDALNTTSTSKEKERNPAQLTIFYSGKVLVFEDYPAEKARELVSLAKKSSSQMSYGILANALGEKPKPRERLPPGISSNTCAAKPNPASGTGNQPVSVQEQVSADTDASGSDLPIARRSSIHRFLEKRKDRAAARGPYHNPEPSSSSSKEGREIDLNL